MPVTMPWSMRYRTWRWVAGQVDGEIALTEGGRNRDVTAGQARSTVRCGHAPPHASQRVRMMDT